MNIRGRVENGVVILEGGPRLPEGAIVMVSCPEAPGNGTAEAPRRVQLPLVPSSRPGSVRLTAERVAELLDDADVSS